MQIAYFRVPFVRETIPRKRTWCYVSFRYALTGADGPTSDLRTADMACRHYGWTRIAFQENGRERGLEEKNDEIYDLILKTIGNK